MNRIPIPGVSARLRGALLAACCTFAVAPQAQDFGDTPYVQTPSNVVKAMLDTAKVGPQDFVIDLGSGDGRMIITAAKEYGARGFGVDHDPRLVELATANAAKEGVSDRVQFHARDLYKTDVSKATVMSIYLLPEVNLMVRPKLLRELAPGTRIVSHDYDMGEWKPDAQFTLPAPGKTVGRDPVSKVFYWMVPANVTGEWRATLGTAPEPTAVTLRLGQKFQFAEGTMAVGGAQVALEGVQLAGAELSFRARLPQAAGAPGVYAFSGRVTGDTIEGNFRSDAGAQPTPWRAQRVGGKTLIGPEVDPGLARMREFSGAQ